MLSVRDIQGQWREKDNLNIWTVNGIVAERAKRQKAQKKPIVLSDGCQGVEWGNGNLKGSLENGYLVWRNRRGEATYCWKKLENASEVPVEEVMTRKVKRTPPLASPPPLPINGAGGIIAPPPPKITAQTKTEEQTPRSTNSAETTETAALAGLGNLALDASNVEGPQDQIAVAEMKMLVEMAGNRLMAGDVYMGMRYITLAQQVQPLLHSFAQGQGQGQQQQQQ
jgi:hypothetical protein